MKDKNVGQKFDAGKLRWTLLPFKAVREVVKVLELGAKKYSVDNWKKVSKQRYKDALMRHITSYLMGEKNDEESGLNHLAHATCCCLFIIWLDLNKKKPIITEEKESYFKIKQTEYDKAYFKRCKNIIQGSKKFEYRFTEDFLNKMVKTCSEHQDCTRCVYETECESLGWDIPCRWNDGIISDILKQQQQEEEQNGN